VKQVEPLHPILAYAWCLQRLNTQSATILADLNRLLHEPALASLQKCSNGIFSAPMLHVLSGKSTGDAITRQPWQVCFCLRNGAGVLAWPDLTAAITNQPGSNPLESGATFVSGEKCGPTIQAIIVAELPPLLVLAHQLLASEVARWS
jgi:hypothetical protein